MLWRAGVQVRLFLHCFIEKKKTKDGGKRFRVPHDHLYSTQQAVHYSYTRPQSKLPFSSTGRAGIDLPLGFSIHNLLVSRESRESSEGVFQKLYSAIIDLHLNPAFLYQICDSQMDRTEGMYPTILITTERQAKTKRGATIITESCNTYTKTNRTHYILYVLFFSCIFYHMW